MNAIGYRVHIAIAILTIRVGGYAADGNVHEPILKLSSLMAQTNPFAAPSSS